MFVYDIFLFLLTAEKIHATWKKVLFLPSPVWLLWSEEEVRVLQTAFLLSALLLDVFEAYFLVSLLTSLDIFVLDLHL